MHNTKFISKYEEPIGDIFKKLKKFQLLVFYFARKTPIFDDFWHLNPEIVCECAQNVSFSKKETSSFRIFIFYRIKKFVFKKKLELIEGRYLASIRKRFDQHYIRGYP